MVIKVLERVYISARMIFDVEDRYARDRGLRGPHPQAIGRLRFWLVGTVDATGPKRFAYPEEMVVVRNPGGYHMFFDKVIPYGSDRPIRRNLPPGTYIVRVTSELEPTRRASIPEADEIYSLVYQWVERQDVIIGELAGTGVVGMAGPYPLALEPGYAYPFPLTLPAGIIPPGGCAGRTYAGQTGPTLLRGALHGTDGAGVVGAVVSAPGAHSSYQVDSNGDWVLVFDDTQPTGPVSVTVTIPKQPPVNLSDVCVIQGFETSLSETALRGWVLRRGVGVSGAHVRVTGLSQPLEVQTQADGGWKLYLPVEQSVGNQTVPVTVTAMLPDGSSLLPKNVDIKPRGTVLVSTFTYS
jgi:hypothetical protein